MKFFLKSIGALGFMMLLTLAWGIFKLPGESVMEWITEKIIFVIVYGNFGVFIVWAIKGIVKDSIEEYNENK